MSINPAELLSGPRGRRLCLELIQRIVGSAPTHDELNGALFWAAHALEPEVASVAIVSAGAGEPPPPPPSTPADVARLLDRVIVDTPDEAALLDALDAAVANARYWQEPDGMDVLGATPEVSEALRRTAATVADAPGAAWWTTPIDRTGQWLVELPDRPRAVTGGAGAVLSRWRAEALADETRARRDRPADPRETISGTWWSMPPADLGRTTRRLEPQGPVGLWLIEDDLGRDRGTVRRVVVPDDAIVYEIDGPRAWADLCERYPFEVTADRRHDWYRATGREGRWCLPDWAGVAADYAGVHLTTAGYLSTAGRAIEVSDELSSVIAGWDPDATWWLTAVSVDEESRQDWRHDDAAGWIHGMPSEPTGS
ncbi:hypothetical protein [Microlunatus speluncae]|uniref:hypothetical protein n=1 Tax=Microlunatus speluncae TaxID=2594267 RepID=UPI0012666DFE|nr:hypothetical protein [Microlunatus speluncae]